MSEVPPHLINGRWIGGDHASENRNPPDQSDLIGLHAARAFCRWARAGLMMTNLPTAGVDHPVPFGGTRGRSFMPREQGPQAVEFHTTLKTSSCRAG